MREPRWATLQRFGVLNEARLLLWEIPDFAGVVARAKLVDHLSVGLGKALNGCPRPLASIGISIERYIRVRLRRYESRSRAKWVHLVGRRFYYGRAVCVLHGIDHLVDMTLLVRAFFLQRDEVFCSSKYAARSVVAVR